MIINLSTVVGTTGYGVVGLNVLTSLSELKDTDVSLFPIGQIEAPPSKHEIIRHAIENSRIFDNYAPSLRISHQNDFASQIGKAMAVGFPFFELDTFTPEECHHLSCLDRIFVPTQWAKGVVDAQLNVDVRVVPVGVDRTIFSEDTVSPRLHLSDHTVFVAIGKLEVRKGYDFLCEAFNRAFSPTDKVILRILGDNPFIGRDGNEKWRSLFLKSRMGSKVIFEDRMTDQSGVATIIGTSDCGVFLSRAEGWNMELLECLSMGKPAIATDYSGHTEYVTDENCRLVKVDQLEPANDGLWFHGQGNWAKLGPNQLEQTIVHMRDVHATKQNGELTGNVAGINTAKHFSWSRMASRIVGEL